MRNLRIGELARLARGAATTGRFLHCTPRWSPDRMRAWQWARIRELVTFAVKSVPFYRDLYAAAGFAPGDLKDWNDFHRLPVVSKEQVIANYPDRMLPPGIDMNGLITSRSSGSSGKVLDIAYDARAMTTYILSGLRLYRMGFDYRPWHRQVYVYTSPYPLRSLFGLYPLRFMSTLTPIDQLLPVMRRFRPDLLVCYPSHLQAIAQATTAADRRQIRPRLISVNSEMSTQAERDAMAEFFGCPVLDEYSSEELTRIAAQCRHKRYHLFEDINLIETVGELGRPTTEMGTIIGTNLHNFAMPIIRYRQDDLGQVAGEQCACGWQFRTLRNLQGRRNDSFVMPSGKVLTSGFLLDATYEFLLAYRAAVKDFCLIQQAGDRIVLQVVAGRGWDADVAGRIASRFRSSLEPSVSFEIQTVAECLKTKTGKRNPIINQTMSTCRRVIAR